MRLLLKAVLWLLESDAENGTKPLAVQKLPSLHGKTRAEARKILEQYGFVFKGFGNKKGYEMWEHPDKSRVDIRPEGVSSGPKGEVCRSKGWRRYDQHGQQIQSHNSGEIVLD